MRTTRALAPRGCISAAAGAGAGGRQRARGAPPGPRPEAHALLVRLEAAEVQSEQPVELAGRGGWAVVASALDGGRRVTVKAVTRVAADACTDDFVLVAGDDFAAREVAFDRWWASFAEPAPG
jgi:hypothetical protein